MTYKGNSKGEWVLIIGAAIVKLLFYLWICGVLLGSLGMDVHISRWIVNFAVLR